MPIRAFHPDDLPRLKEILVDAFDGVSIDQAMERRFGTIHGRDWRWRKGRHLDEDVRRDSAGVFVLELDGVVAGCISTRVDRDAGVGFIPNLAIAAEFRGRGWGRKLLQQALQRFRREGLTHARIETLAQNAIGDSLYRDLGFEEVARQIHFCLDLDQTEHHPAKSPQGKETEA
jgi:ribosomal protein S18 acetylase RimI-like enzyme